jgi:hypothetical protein
MLDTDDELELDRMLEMDDDEIAELLDEDDLTDDELELDLTFTASIFPLTVVVLQAVTNKPRKNTRK